MNIPWKQYLKRLQKLLPVKKVNQTATMAQSTTKNNSGKRPKNFHMPSWALKDWFAKKDLGTMVPPEELRDEAGQSWGTYGMKVGPLDQKPHFEKIGPSKSQRQKAPASHQEVSNFLEDFLEKPEK